MELSDIVRLLRTTYWAGDRPVEVIETALKNSRCFGIRLPGSNTLAAFARVVSDGATMYYLADVVVDEAWHRLGSLDVVLHHRPEDLFLPLRQFHWVRPPFGLCFIILA